MGEHQQAVERGKALVHDHLDAIVESLEESSLSWTTQSAYFDLASQIFRYLKGEVDEELLEMSRPDILRGMEKALEESGEFEVEVKSSDDPDDPASEYRRVVLAR